MKIYTSYYKRFSSLCGNLIPVRVSNTEPSWLDYNTVELSMVYPNDLVWLYKNGSIDWEAYEQIYLQRLNNIGKDAILRKLEEISQDNNDGDIVLLCWEAKGNCHRKLLGDFLECGVEEI